MLRKMRGYGSKGELFEVEREYKKLEELSAAEKAAIRRRVHKRERQQTRQSLKRLEGNKDD